RRHEDAAIYAAVREYPLERIGQWIADVVDEVDKAVARVGPCEQKAQAEANNNLDHGQGDPDPRGEHTDPAACKARGTRRGRGDLFLGVYFIASSIDGRLVNILAFPDCRRVASRFVYQKP